MDLSFQVRVAILSDTHGLLRKEVKEILRTCSYIIHAGDVDQPFLVREMVGIAPVYLVKGNADGEWAENYSNTLTFSIAGIRFFLIHNKKEIPSIQPKEDVIVFGHSHQYFCEEKDGVLWINPGSCGKENVHQEITLAVMTIGDGQYQVEKIVLKPQEDKKDSSSERPE